MIPGSLGQVGSKFGPNTGMLSIFTAVQSGHAEIVLSLVESGVDVDIRDFQRDTPLTRATSRNNRRMVRCLLSKGANVKLPNNNGQTAWAIDLEAKNIESRSLLSHYCICRQHADGFDSLYSF